MARQKRDKTKHQQGMRKGAFISHSQWKKAGYPSQQEIAAELAKPATPLADRSLKDKE